MIEIPNIKFPKIIFLMLLITLMVSLWPTSVRANAPAPVNVTVEGKPLEMSVPPIIMEDRTMVGVRFVGEAVGGTLTWDPVTRQVTVTRGADTVILRVGQKQALINGKAEELPVAPQIVDDRTMVPLRFIAEALGGTVEWNDSTRTVNILRKPTVISGLTYRNDPDKGRVVLTLSEPFLRVTEKTDGTNAVLELYPAVVTEPQANRRILDSLMKELNLQVDGRTVRFTAQTWSQPNFRYSLSSDGNQLAIEFDHNVTGYQLRQDRRISAVDLSATGKVEYTAFPLTNPPRVVVDIPGAHLAPEAPESVDVTNPYIARIRAADRGADGVRIVVDMKETVPFDVVSTDTGLQVLFLPRIEALKTERLQGKTRLTLTGSLPMDPKVSLTPDQRQLKIEVPQGRSALANNQVKIADGTVDTITLAPGVTPNSMVITIALPYYLGHTVVSKSGDSSITVDLISSPVYGKRIWIDAGHGRIPGAKDDPGSIGKTYKTYEKTINLQVALELQRRLQAAGATVFMTRTGDDGVDFTQRPALVNRVKPAMDLFVSIHHNSAASVTVRGTETYYWTTNPKSHTAAQKIHAAIVKGLGFPDRNVRQDSFFVIKETKAPSVLLELGYLSNAAEEKAIAEPGIVAKTYPAKAAEAIKNGILDHFWQEIKPAVAN
ncbi:MAG TPA: N-acetylmuramoyl-L-alanine amidase family protein [Symbiobacteriaceae bacterium]|nr:N-acetylmuramoyl-L-alanine amidase family protein [Symbiobacteriaceae bacterium]